LKAAWVRFTPARSKVGPEPTTDPTSRRELGSKGLRPRSLIAGRGTGQGLERNRSSKDGKIRSSKNIPLRGHRPQGIRGVITGVE